MKRTLHIFVLVALLASACATDDEPTGSSTSTAPPIAGTIVLTVEEAPGCDLLQDRHCNLPFPSDAFSVADPDTDSGRRLAFNPDLAAVNVQGTQVDVTDWNRADGFSSGSPLLVYAEGVDLEASGVGPITDLSVSVSDESPIVVIDAETGERHPHWAELDLGAEADEDRLLMIRPARNFANGHRYIVAMRGLVDGTGAALEPSDVFRAYRDRLESDVPQVEERRAHMEGVFATLGDAGVGRDDLWLAWDFTVMSSRSLSERVLTIRDDAFARLGDDAPAFEITEVEQPNEGDAVSSAYFVEGTVQVPLYLTGAGEPGSSFNYGDDGLPVQNPDTPEYTATFRCTVPNAAVADGAAPARPVVYGHGLLGSRGEVDARNIRLMTDEHNMVYCATEWIGMAEEDIGNAAAILGDIGKFPTLADRMQQGFLNFMFLGRLMIHPDGLGSDPAFQVDGASIIDTSELFYDGNSQGAIAGGALTAVAIDWERAVLGVPGMNYSTLLARSVDFDQFSPLSIASYPDHLERRIGFAMAQILWDRAETSGYANHLTDDPLPGTPEHKILLHVAFGDFQVADITAFNEARTIGAAYHDPVLADGRGAIDYTFGLEPMEYPWSGSAVVMWDADVPAPPLGNTPPRGDGDPSGEPHDPHEDPRMQVTAREQKSAFLSTDGVVIDVCDAGPCLVDERT